MLLSEVQSSDIGKFRLSECLPITQPSISRAILLIEDDELVRTPLAKMLEFLGWDVVEASSGENALLALKDHPEFAAILVDYSMTGMNGRETLQAIRATGCKSPAILCSGYISVTDDALREQEFHGILQKPFRRQQLEAMLKKVTGH